MNTKVDKYNDLELILNSLEDIILVINPDGIIIREFRSELDSPLFNYLVAATGKHYRDAFPNNFVERIENALQLSSEKGEVQFFDIGYADASGLSWYNVRLGEIGTHKGDLNGYSIFIRDITRRKKAEENYRMIFENAVMGIYQSTDGEGRHISANPALAKIYGYDSVKDLIGNVSSISKQLFVDPDKRKKLLKILHEEGECLSFESQVYKKNGEIIWISENAKVVKDDNDQILFIVGTVKDITKRKFAEEKLRRAKEDWERTFDALDDTITILDDNLQVLRMNKAARERIGVNAEESALIGCKDIFRCEEDYCKKCPAKLTIDDEKPRVAELENTMLGKTFLVSTSPKFNDDEKLIGVVFVAKDITEEKRLRQESEYRMQQVIQADKLKSLGEMVASVAHEINNPNSFILYNAALIDDSWEKFKPIIDNYIAANPNNDIPVSEYKEMSEELTEIIDSVKTGSNRIKNIVSNVKDFARSESVQKFEEIDINNVIDKAFEIIGAKVRRMVKSININKADQLPLVTGQLQKLEQVLINIIDNSIQSIDDRKEGRLTVSSGYIKRINSVLLEVEDNGRGISKDVLSRIFEPFFTTRRDIGGTGLGLSVSYEIINKHNGKIGVISKEGAGTKFSIFLPVNEFLPELHPKILCVDEGFEIYNKMRVSFLEETDKFISVISEPANTVKFLTDHPEVDVVVINMNIGELGWKIVERIRTTYPLIELIFYSDEIDLNKEIKSRNISNIRVMSGALEVTELKSILNSLVRQKL